MKQPTSKLNPTTTSKTATDKTIDEEIAEVEKRLKLRKLLRDEEADRAGFPSVAEHQKALFALEEEARKKILDAETIRADAERIRADYAVKSAGVEALRSECIGAVDKLSEVRDELYWIGQGAGKQLLDMASAFARALRTMESYGYWKGVWESGETAFAPFLAYFRLSDEVKRGIHKPHGITLKDLISPIFEDREEDYLMRTGFMEALNNLHQKPIPPVALIPVSTRTGEFDTSEQETDETKPEDTEKGEEQ